MWKLLIEFENNNWVLSLFKDLFHAQRSHGNLTQTLIDFMPYIGKFLLTWHKWACLRGITCSYLHCIYKMTFLGTVMSSWLLHLKTRLLIEVVPLYLSQVWHYTTLVPEALMQRERERERESKRKNPKWKEGPLASAVENLTSMLSTSLLCLHIESQ